MIHLSLKQEGRSLASLSLAMLLPSLGISVANIALPSLQTAFGATSQQAQWVVIAYLVVVTSALVTAGRLGDLLGRKPLLLVGIGIFSTASMIAVFAPSLWVVILARASQGVGAAMMMSLTVAAVGDAISAERSGTAMGLLGTVSAIGTAAGPSLGGLLIKAYGWASIFVLMAVVGLIAGLLVATQLPSVSANSRRPAFDVAGAFALMLTVAAFALATTLVPFTIVNALFAGLAVLGAGAFVSIERRAIAPLVRLHELRRPAQAGGLLSIGLVSAIVMTTLVVGPFYLTGVLGLDTVASGLVMTVGPAVSAIVGLPSGRLVDRKGSTVITHFGLWTLLAGTVAMMMLPGKVGVAGYVLSLVLITSGYALFQTANNTSLMAGTDKEQRGVTSALLALSRNSGLIIGASAMGAVFAVGSGSGGDAGEFGLQLVFATASAFVAVALGLSTWATRKPAVTIR